MRFISLLRGINVSGQKKIKMADLKGLYEEWGFEQVLTYIQSGNVVFQGTGLKAAAARKRIEEGITAAYGFEVPVTIRTATEWGNVLAHCPLGEIDVAAEGSKCAVIFLSSAPQSSQVAELEPYLSDADEMVVVDRELYMRCPGGFGRTKLTTSVIERKLKVSATARNWKTVLKLQDMVNS